MTRPPLRWVFLVPILVAIVIGFAAFAIYIDGVERSNRLADIDAELVRAARDVGAPVDGQPSPAEPPGSGDPAPPVDIDDPVHLVVGADGSVTSTGGSGNPFSPSTIAALRTIDGFHTVGAENYRVLVVSPDGQVRTVTALSLDGVDAAAVAFRGALALGGGIILLLVAAVVWLLVRSLTRPIIGITAVATRIADGDLDTDLDTDLDAPTRSREIADLNGAVDRMLTRLRSTLEQREQAAAEAMRARDDMQRFLADMAHELRTPLTALKGYSDLYAGGMLESTTDVDRAMSRIGSESERLYRLADDMLRLARDGASDETTEVVDVAAIAAEVADDLRAADPDHRITFHADSGDHRVTGTPARIHQAILNLGANACNHSGPEAEVAIRVESDGATVVTRVVDHGPGIDPADRHRVFLPFYRTDASRSRQGRSGAGLGLAVTRQIVDRHRGTVTIETTPGGGATLVLSLPRDGARPAISPRPSDG